MDRKLISYYYYFFPDSVQVEMTFTASCSEEGLLKVQWNYFLIIFFLIITFLKLAVDLCISITLASYLHSKVQMASTGTTSAKMSWEVVGFTSADKFSVTL